MDNSQLTATNLENIAQDVDTLYNAIQIGEAVDLAEAFINSITRKDECFLCGEYAHRKNNLALDGSISIGYGACAPRDRSLILNTGPNNFRNPDSNINFMNAAEGNSNTGDFRFHGTVEADSAFSIPDTMAICELEKCDVCGFELQKMEEVNEAQIHTELCVEKNRGLPGITWSGQGFIGNLCFDCMRDATMQYQAQKNWNNQNGDPVMHLQNKVAKLENLVAQLTERLLKMRK